MGIALTYGKVFGKDAYFFRIGEGVVVAIEPEVLTERMQKEKVVRSPVMGAYAEPVCREVVWVRKSALESKALLFAEGDIRLRPGSVPQLNMLETYDYVTYRDKFESKNFWFLGVALSDVAMARTKLKDFGYEII